MADTNYTTKIVIEGDASGAASAAGKAAKAVGGIGTAPARLFP